MKRLLFLLAVLLAPIPASATDYANSYALLNALAQTIGRAIPFVVLCPSTDGSNSAVACSFGGTATTPSLTYTTPLTYTAATTSGTLIAAGTYKTAFQLCTLPGSTANVWLNPTGGTAVVNTGIPVESGGKCTNFGTTALPLPTGAVTAITDGASSQTLAAAGG